MVNANETYKVIRFHRDSNHPDHQKVIKEGLTLEQAQRHCQDESTKGYNDAMELEWFDGYEQM
jgi:hypothetical protein